MPPRYAYWTILVDKIPTAFRAKERDELLPTFERLRHKHPDTVMMWFARGRLWTSPEAAREAAARRSDTPPARGRNWRPGGEHQDPRDRFRQPARDKWKKMRQARHERATQGARPKPAWPKSGPPSARSKPSWPTSAGPPSARPKPALAKPGSSQSARPRPAWAKSRPPRPEWRKPSPQRPPSEGHGPKNPNGKPAGREVLKTEKRGGSRLVRGKRPRRDDEKE
jgi:hypothetical protein